MAWNKRLSQLNDALSNLIRDANTAVLFLNRAEIKIGMINFDGGSLTMWYNILNYAENNNRVDELVDEIMKQYPDNEYLKAYKEGSDYNLGVDIKDVDWKGSISNENLEKITEGNSTLLPIKFLSIGLEKAKSVARVVILREGRKELGTGFLIENNFFVTNHHVIRNIESANIAIVEFDYEESVNGNMIEPTRFSFDTSEGKFFTSKEFDWTIVKIKGDANSAFGFLALNGNDVKKGDFVNIIQHPGGGLKQIAMYHNTVMYVDDKNIQYLTDTLPGSSGSPVFNSNWEVVGLHNSGGVLFDPSMKQRFLRNQGINITKVIEGIENIN